MERNLGALRNFAAKLLFAVLTTSWLASADPPATSPPSPPQATPSPLVTPRGLSLPVCYRLAIDNSPRLAELRARVYEQGAKVDEAFVGAYPTVAVTGNSTHTTPEVSSTQNGRLTLITPNDSYNMSLNVRQALLTFGRLRWSTAMAELNQKSSQEEYRREVESLFDDVTTSYHDAVLARTRVNILEERFEALRTQLRDSESLFKRGTVAKFDVLRSQAELSNSQQQLLTGRNAARQAADQLLSRLGQSLGQEILLDNLPLPGPPPTDVEKATAQALDRRPELGVVSWALESARARISYESSQNKPRLDALTQATQRTSTSLLPAQTWSTWLQLSFPLWDGGLSEARKAQATHVVEQLTASLENARRSVRLEVRDAYNTLQNLWEKKDVAASTKAQAAEALRVARIRYNAGVSTQAELQLAHSSYSESEFAEAQTWRDYHIAWSRWRRVISEEYPAYVPGPLLRPRAPETPPALP